MVMPHRYCTRRIISVRDAQVKSGRPHVAHDERDANIARGRIRNCQRSRYASKPISTANGQRKRL
jgi:hypothetical protein